MRPASEEVAALLGRDREAVARLRRDGVVLAPLRRDSACCRDLNWRIDVPSEVDPARFEEELVAAGWDSRCKHPALRVLRHPEGHEMAYVMETGRVQLRIDVMVPMTTRRRRAQALYEELRRRMGRCLAPAVR